MKVSKLVVDGSEITEDIPLNIESVQMACRNAEECINKLSNIRNMKFNNYPDIYLKGLFEEIKKLNKQLRKTCNYLDDSCKEYIEESCKPLIELINHKVKHLKEYLKDNYEEHKDTIEETDLL